MMWTSEDLGLLLQTQDTARLNGAQCVQRERGWEDYRDLLERAPIGSRLEFTPESDLAHLVYVRVETTEYGCDWTRCDTSANPLH